MSRRPERVNNQWRTPEGKPGEAFTWEHVKVEVLQDIRSELTRIRQLLECGNIQRMFRTIERLDKRVAKHAKLK
jgi:hypothetical protein